MLEPPFTNITQLCKSSVKEKKEGAVPKYKVSNRLAGSQKIQRTRGGKADF